MITILGAVGVALTQDEMTGDSMPFHEAMAAADLPRSTTVVVNVPVWRGLSFLGVLAWLVAARLAAPDATVQWRAPRKVLPSVRRTLAGLGWDLNPEGEATPPPGSDLPEPKGFDALGARFHSDWGVFGAHGLDAGTQLLFDVARQQSPVPTLSDVGTGSGPLAVGLALAGQAADVVMSDVDSVALHLARGNAERAGVPHRLVFGSNPTSWPATGATVCNFPTHLARADSEALLRGLVTRARAEPVHIVVHATLRARFEAAIRRLGGEPNVMAETTHAVVGVTRKTR